LILDFSLTIVREGTTQLIVPADYTISGPSTSSMPVFYNPQMEFSRDFSVALLSNLLKEGDSFLDGLAAAGSGGIRIANECGKKIRLHLNDVNPKSVELITRNLDLNGISDAFVTQENLKSLLLHGSFDCIDIDPFGTPTPFFPMAIDAVRDNGILCVTATDTGSISGIFLKACFRKYGCKARRTPFAHELGVRNLIGFIAREAAASEVGINPIASYYADHYVRTFLRIKKGKKESEICLQKLGYCEYDPKTLERHYTKDFSEGFIGPIWIDGTSDPVTLRSMSMPRYLRTADRLIRVRDLLIMESKINRPFFEVDEFSRMFKINPPGMEHLLSAIGEKGLAVRTHFSPKSFSTNLNLPQISQVFK